MAIQVNGTTVIDNSRNLTNITSVDSTTATAIGNAGVGGGLTLLRTTTFSGSYSSIDITLDSGYKFHRLVYSMPVPSTGWNGVQLRFFDPTSTIISGGEYDWTGWNNQSDSNGAGTGYALASYTYHRNLSGDFIYGTMDIYNARESNRQTTWNISNAERSSGYGGSSTVKAVFHGAMRNTEVNTKVRFFPSADYLSTQSGRTDFIQTYAV